MGLPLPPDLLKGLSGIPREIARRYLKAFMLLAKANKRKPGGRLGRSGFWLLARGQVHYEKMRRLCDAHPDQIPDCVKDEWNRIRKFNELMRNGQSSGL